MADAIVARLYDALSGPRSPWHKSVYHSVQFLRDLHSTGPVALGV